MGTRGRAPRARRRNVDGVTHRPGLGRLDFSPQIRYPFKRWQWFTVNSSFAWRDTFYTRSQRSAQSTSDTPAAIVDEATEPPVLHAAGARSVGPVFTRVWDTPGQRLRRAVQAHRSSRSSTCTRTSPIDNFDRIVQIDGIDGVVGNATNFAYGLNNRFYAKREARGESSQAQEIVDVDVSQTYYTDARRRSTTAQYSTTTGGAPPNHFSPVSLSVRATPTRRLQCDVARRVRQPATASSGRCTARATTTGPAASRPRSAGASGSSSGLPGFNDPSSLDHYLNGSTNARTLRQPLRRHLLVQLRRLRSALLQQRIPAFYNAQCCGIAFEYQRVQLRHQLPRFPSDHRFFLSFTLAGLGQLLAVQRRDERRAALAT